MPEKPNPNGQGTRTLSTTKIYPVEKNAALCLHDLARLEVLPRSLHRTVTQSQLFGRYQAIYVPRRREVWRPLRTDISVLPSWMWLVTTLELSLTDSLLTDVLLALVLGNLGQWEGNESYFHISSTLHTRAIRQLKARLASRQQSLLDSTFVAIMVFGLYELQIGSGARGDAWLAHVQGVSALLTLRGRSMFSTSYGRTLFWGSQFNQFIIAVRSRGRSIAPCPEFPGPGYPTADDLRLYPIVQRLPLLIAKVDQFQNISSQLSNSYGSVQCSRIASDLLKDLSTLEVDLTTWRLSLCPDAALFWDEPSTLYTMAYQSRSISLEFATMVCFPSIRIAFAIVLSWTASLVLALNKRPFLSFVSADALSDDHITALRIARSLEYFLHPDMGLIGTNLIGMSLAISREYFLQNGLPGEQAWFDVIDERMIQMRTGLGMFLKELRSTGHRTI